MLCYRLVQLAKEEKMHLVGMAFGISHLVQPLDDDVSDMIRDAFNKYDRLFLAIDKNRIV